MIYTKLIFREPTNRNLTKLNELIEYLESKLYYKPDWNTSKSVIKVKYESNSTTKNIIEHVLKNFRLVKLFTYNEEEKTETLMIIVDGFITGKYKLPLFPEDYKF